MQLIEGIVWSYGSNPDINFYASVNAAGLLMLQPIASILAVSPGQYTVPMLISYVVLGLISQLIDHKTDPRSLREQYQMREEYVGRGVWGRLRLHWGWLDPIPWASLAIYFIFLLGPLILSKQYDFVTLVLLTLAVSIYSFGKGWGSMWCWVVNLMVIMFGGNALVKALF